MLIASCALSSAAAVVYRLLCFALHCLASLAVFARIGGRSNSAQVKWDGGSSIIATNTTENVSNGVKGGSFFLLFTRCTVLPKSDVVFMPWKPGNGGDLARAPRCLMWCERRENGIYTRSDLDPNLAYVIDPFPLVATVQYAAIVNTHQEEESWTTTGEIERPAVSDWLLFFCERWWWDSWLAIHDVGLRLACHRLPWPLALRTQIIYKVLWVIMNDIIVWSTKTSQIMKLFWC